MELMLKYEPNIKHTYVIEAHIIRNLLLLFSTFIQIVALCNANSWITYHSGNLQINN